MAKAKRTPIEMIHIPAGPFILGSNVRIDEKPIQTVSLPEYWMARTHTTNEQFDEFVRETGYITLAEKDEWSYTYTGSEWGEIKGADWRHPEGPGSSLVNRMDHPVLNVSWYDAMQYCRWLSETRNSRYRLPTETEWEKAGRGGLELANGSPNPIPDRQYPWGNYPPDESRCNFEWQIGTRTPVGHYAEKGGSPYGCQDMAGNAWEWCLNRYFPYPYIKEDGREDEGDIDVGPTDESGNRSVRGGSWHEDRWVSRVPGRGRTSAMFRDCYLTFRPVRVS